MSIFYLDANIPEKVYRALALSEATCCIPECPGASLPTAE
jgi:hypothetical protein